MSQTGGSGKYVVNFEEMVEALRGIEITPGLTELDLSRLEQLLEENLSAILELLKLLSGERKLRTKDMSIHIPALQLKFEHKITVPVDAVLTGITFSQSGWKPQDTVTLLAGDTVLLDHIHTKEIGERREFPAWQRVSAGTEISVQYDNISGNSKMFFCDLEYIELRQPELLAGEEL